MRRSLVLPFASFALSLLFAAAALAQSNGVEVVHDPKTGIATTQLGHIKQSSWEQMHPRRKTSPRAKTTKMKTHTIKKIKVAKGPESKKH